MASMSYGQHSTPIQVNIHIPGGISDDKSFLGRSRIYHSNTPTRTSHTTGTFGLRRSTLSDVFNPADLLGETSRRPTTVQGARRSTLSGLMHPAEGFKSSLHDGHVLAYSQASAVATHPAIPGLTTPLNSRVYIANAPPEPRLTGAVPFVVKGKSAVRDPPSTTESTAGASAGPFGASRSTGQYFSHAPQASLLAKQYDGRIDEFELRATETPIFSMPNDSAQACKPRLHPYLGAHYASSGVNGKLPAPAIPNQAHLSHSDALAVDPETIPHMRDSVSHPATAAHSQQRYAEHVQDDDDISRHRLQATHSAYGADYASEPIAGASGIHRSRRTPNGNPSSQSALSAASLSLAHAEYAPTPVGIGEHDHRKDVPAAITAAQALRASSIDYRPNFRDDRQQMVTVLLEELETHVFKDRLPPIEIVWHTSLVAMAGRVSRPQYVLDGQAAYRIEIDDRIYDLDAVMDTISHMLCHIAIEVIDEQDFTAEHDRHFETWGREIEQFRSDIDVCAYKGCEHRFIQKRKCLNRCRHYADRFTKYAPSRNRPCKDCAQPLRTQTRRMVSARIAPEDFADTKRIRQARKLFQQGNPDLPSSDVRSAIETERQADDEQRCNEPVDEVTDGLGNLKLGQ